jgi:hypothetical protein
VRQESREKYTAWIKELYSDNYTENVRFSWCTNLLDIRFSTFLDDKCPDISKLLQWNYSKVMEMYLPCDFYLKKMNSLLVIDESFKFSSYRLKTLNQYKSVDTYFDVQYHIELCNKNHIDADDYQKNKRRSDFDFLGGATAKRALLDVMLDLKPLHNNLKPTIRLTEFELQNISNKKELLELIEMKCR